MPTDRHTTIPNDSGPISVRFDDDPKLLNCKIARARCVRPFPGRLGYSAYRYLHRWMGFKTAGQYFRQIFGVVPCSGRPEAQSPRYIPKIGRKSGPAGLKPIPGTLITTCCFISLSLSFFLNTKNNDTLNIPGPQTILLHFSGQNTSWKSDLWPGSTIAQHRVNKRCPSCSPN